MRRVAVGLGVAAALGLLVVALWHPGDGEPVPAPARSDALRVSAEAAGVVSPPLPPAHRPALADGADGLAAVLHEEQVPVASGAVVEGIEQDRPWVCAGESMSLAARVGGTPEPGAVSRWVWPTEGGGAELSPGPVLHWKAPMTAGTQRVRFQLCRDLGGRRVGVLAERVVEIDVRRCGEGERQNDEPLHVTFTQRGQGSFVFQAVYQGRTEIASYAWSFGDGVTASTTGPKAEHAYSLDGLGPNDLKSFTVKVEARPSRGRALTASVFVPVRGAPPGGERPPLELEISRWQPSPDGKGWRSDVRVRNSSEAEVTWERLERLIQRDDGRMDVETRRWSDVIHVDERLERGGFRGYVTVSPDEAGPGVRQIVDLLHGHDATGKEVEVSWTPFKREPPQESFAPVEVPRK